MNLVRACLFILLVAPALFAQTLDATWPITTQEVDRAISKFFHDRGPWFEPVTLATVPLITVGRPNPMLEVVSATYDPVRHMTRFRLVVKDEPSHLPFEVMAAGKVSGPAVSEAHQNAVPSSVPSKPLVRRGERVSLQLKADGFRYAASAVALNSGALGDRIRVQDSETRKTYDAEVIGEGVVFGRIN